MRKLSLSLLGMLLVLALVLAGCGSDDDSEKSKDPTATAVPEPTQEVVEETEESTAGDADAALQITGSVANVMAWTEDEVRAMETMDAESTNSKGETETYTGVSLNALLALALPAGDATTLTLIGETEAEVALADVTTCADCILSFRSKGGFSAVLPGLADDAQVKGVTEIVVK